MAVLKTIQTGFAKIFTPLLVKRLPAISGTEREAIKAGNTWLEKDLFCGKPQWAQWMATLKKPTLTREEEDFLEYQVDYLCSLLDDWQIMQQDHQLSEKVWHYLKKERFLGIVVPKEYGGLGFSALAHSSIVSKIATRSFSAAVSMMVPNSLGPAELILHYGTAEQKKFYLPRLASGEEIPCFALTSTEAGSDAGSIIDTGIVCQRMEQGKAVLGIRLNWDKRYITLAPIASLIGLAFHLYDPDHLLGDKEDVGITVCLVNRSTPGVDMGQRHCPLYFAFLNGPTRGRDVFVPLDAIVGGVSMAGKGWHMLMECLSIGRSISLPALSAASAKLAYRVTGAYAQLRQQFHTSIAKFEGVEQALALIAGYTYTLEACRIMTASAVDLNLRPAIVSAIAKYHMTEMARIVVNQMMDVHGGHGIQLGPRNIIGHLYLGIPISITV